MMSNDKVGAQPAMMSNPIPPFPHPRPTPPGPSVLAPQLEGAPVGGASSSSADPTVLPLLPPPVFNLLMRLEATSVRLEAKEDQLLDTQARLIELQMEDTRLRPSSSIVVETSF